MRLHRVVRLSCVRALNFNASLRVLGVRMYIFSLPLGWLRPKFAMYCAVYDRDHNQHIRRYY